MYCITKIHHLFIDFKAACNCIDRCRLYAAMEELNIQQKLIALVKATVNNTQCQVKIKTDFQTPSMLKMEFDKGVHWFV